MSITLQNIKEITHNAFQEAIYDKLDNLEAIKNFFDIENTPLNTMIYEEFNFYWNDLFSKQVLEYAFIVPFPDFVTPSVSIWVLNWKEYIEKKYTKNYFSSSFTVREMPVQQLQDEIDKLQTFFTHQKKPISSTLFQSLENGLSLTIPHYYSDKNSDDDDFSNPFSPSFIACVFYLAKIKTTTTVVNDKDLIKFFQSYYSYFYKDKESGRDNIFNTTCYQKTDHVKIMEQRLHFLKPRSIEESSLLYNLNVSSYSFAQALNEVIGLKEYSDKTKENYAIMQLQSFFTSIKVDMLDNKFQLRHNIHTKKSKI